MNVLKSRKLFSTTNKVIQYPNLVYGVNNTLSPSTIDTSQSIYNSSKSYEESISSHYDAIIVGAGHNGLVCATYLANAGKKVLILEKRHVVGGAAVTEELVQGYKQSRCSYVLSLLRRKVIDELYGQDFFDKVKLHKRDPNGLTPTREDGNFLLLKPGKAFIDEIAKHSKADARKYNEFEHYLQRMIDIVEPMLDIQPPKELSVFNNDLLALLSHFIKNRKNLMDFYHFVTSSTTSCLDRYFESEILKATLATDSIIGANKSPECTGSAYVLLHHIMGQIKPEEPGYWYYVEVSFNS